MNISNFGIVEGRLTKDPVVFPNQDGSKKIMITVAARDNFKGQDGKRGTQFVQLEAFVPNNVTGNGVYDYMHTGDKIGVSYTVRSNNYTDKQGNPVYGQVLFIQDVELKESKTTTDARQAANNENETPAEPAPAPAPASEDDKKSTKKTGGKKTKAAEAEDAPFGAQAE